MGLHRPGAFGGPSCGLCPQLACLARPLVGCRSGILDGGLAVPPRSPLRAGAGGSDARLPLGLVTLIVLVGGVCLFPSWLISYPWGDFRPCQHPVPVNFLLVGSVSLTILPNPVRWLAGQRSPSPPPSCPLGSGTGLCFLTQPVTVWPSSLVIILMSALSLLATY